MGSSTKFGDGGLGRTQTPYGWTKAANTELVKCFGDWFNLDYEIRIFTTFLVDAKFVQVNMQPLSVYLQNTQQMGNLFQ